MVALTHTCTSGDEKGLGETAHQNTSQMFECSDTQFNISFNFFIAKTFTVLEAGLALKTQGSLVKGLMPFFAGVAAFFFSFILSMPANLKFPFFLISAAATAMR